MSTTRRIYLPLSHDQLQALHQARELAGEELAAFAVTEASRADRPSVDDDEVLEYAAIQDAALVALADGAEVVGAADVAVTAVHEDGADARVEVRGPVALKRLASFHLIDREAAEADPDDEIELSWFDATELPLLLDVIANQ